MSRFLYFLIDWVLMPMFSMIWIFLFATHGFSLMGSVTLGMFVGLVNSVAIGLAIRALLRENTK